MLSAVSFSVLLALTAGGAPAQSAPSRPAEASSGDLRVLQIATTDPDALMAAWETPTEGVELMTSTQTTRNKPIVTFIVFTGCRAGHDGLCNLTATAETTGPDGKRYDLSKDMAIWRFAPAPDFRLQLSMSGYGLRIEDKDPLGAYRVRVAVTDHVAKTTVRTEQTLLAVEE